MSAAPVVFLGPSLPLARAQAILPDARFEPPAGQGDLFRAARTGPSAIGLIDGIFRDAPTVRHREILWAMAQGIPVFGAASMGALRAAELDGEGMIGVGLIFRWYRRFPLLPDDAVAVTHAPAALGSAPLSAALVDIRRSLAAARRAGELTPDQVAKLRAEAEATPFPDRRHPETGAPRSPSQKARDAEALLHRMARHLGAGDWPRPATDPPALVHAWLDDLADSGLSLDGNV